MKAALKIIISFFIIISAFVLTYDDEYIAFHQEKRTTTEALEKLDEQLSLIDVTREDHPSAQVYMTPDLDLLDRFVQMIDGAQERVWIEIYIFTEKRLRQALIDAHDRGVDVRVIFEPHVFGAPSINDETKNILTQTGISITDASGDLYTFTHSKILLIDDTYIIGTGNLSYSSFRYNREFYVMGDDVGVLDELENMWIADSQHSPYISLHPSLVLSPHGSREKISQILSSARESLTIYAQSLADPQIKELIKQKHDEGIEIMIYMGNIEKYPANEDDIEELVSYGIQIETPKNPYIHAKTIFVDEHIGYVGSINFTTNSIENNREVGIIFEVE